MRKDDRGATLIEVIMGIVLLGLLAPVIFYMVFSIGRSFKRAMAEEQMYQVTQAAIEQAKASGPQSVANKLRESLPIGYFVKVEEQATQVDGLDLAEYKVTVTTEEGVKMEYIYYWKQ